MPVRNKMRHRRGKGVGISERFDLVVLGGGAAGLLASLTAAGVGARVALVEAREQPGGDCLFTGCVPSKSLIASANLAHAFRTADRLGLEPSEPGIDFARVMERVEAVIAEAGRRDRPEELEARGVRVIRGHGRFLAPGLLGVGDAQVGYRAAIIATGALPVIPEVAGIDGTLPLTSESVFELRELPRRLAVLGGGSVGVELAQAFARLGSKVSIIEAQERLLPTEDPEAARLLEQALIGEGIELRLGARASRVEPGSGGSGALVLERGERVVYDRLLVAVGRRPSVERLGLEQVGVAVDARGAVQVDGALKTTGERIYAAGDVIAGPMFTHVAGYHGLLAAGNALFRTRRTVDHSHVPHVVFTDPELARVGMTEQEAAEHLGEPPLILRHDYADSDRAMTAGEAHGLAKLVADGRGRLLGATIFAPAAGESIAEVTRLVSEGKKVADLSQMMHAYPTFSEGPARAADEWWTVRYLNPRGRRLLYPLLRLLGTVGSRRRATRSE